MCPIPLHFQQTFTLLPVAALKTYTEGGPSSLKSTSNARLSSMEATLASTLLDGGFGVSAARGAIWPLFQYARHSSSKPSTVAW